MLTILVGNVDAHIDEDVCANDWRFMPCDLVEVFYRWYNDVKNTPKTIRVYNDILLNYIGEMIENGYIDPEMIVVKTDQGYHSYNSNGVFNKDWPYGIFNWS